MKNKKTSDTHFFFEWCAHNKVSIKINQELFFVAENSLMKPEFITANKIYIDIVSSNEITDTYINNCKSFSRSFGTIVVIPREILLNFDNISKKDIQDEYGIKF